MSDFGTMNDSIFYEYNDIEPIAFSETNITNSSNASNGYDYNIEEAMETFFWDQLIPPLVIYAFTFIVGIVGNFLIIYTIARCRRLKSTTNVFLSSLASADLLVILVCIPVKLARLFSYTWTFGLITCKTVYYVQSVSAICSVLTLTSMSVERYYAIVYPMKAQYQCTISKARRVCVFIWFLSLLLASPTIIAQVHMEVGMRRIAYWCVRNFDSVVVWPVYETYILILVLILPAGIMGFAYFSIYVAVCAMAASRRRMINYKPNGISYLSDKQRRKEEHEATEVKQVVTMLVVVVLLFVICWAPILIINMLKAYVVIDIYSLIVKNLTTAADLLSYCNSCVNPVVYGFLSKNFRDSFRQALCCHTFKRKPSLSSQMSLSTRFSSVKHTDATRFNYSVNGIPMRTSKSLAYRIPGDLYTERNQNTSFTLTRSPQTYPEPCDITYINRHAT